MALIAKKKKLPKNSKKKLSAEERRILAAQRAFANAVRAIFSRSGFTRLPNVDGKHFDFGGVGEFDDAFYFENVIILAEHTLSKSENIGPHLKAKAHLYNRIQAEPAAFLNVLAKHVPALKNVLDNTYTSDQCIVGIVYFSRGEVQASHQALAPNVSFASWSRIRYFHRLATTLKKSSRYEIFDFLNIDSKDIGVDGSIRTVDETSTFNGSLLPESHSNFPVGFKVVSFYVDPESLLRRAYVLRRDGWRDTLGVYQRMIIPKKISAIRRYLRETNRVFANNVVLTLPDTTELLSEDNKQLDPKKLTKSSPVKIRLPNKANTVGVVDGQHRIFSYYEDNEKDLLIDKYRHQQNLLATGIVYPDNTSSAEKERFEAKLFLEINSNQSSAKSDLKQAISLILDPYAPLSMARRVVQGLAENGPLEGLLEKNVFDAGKIKTTTIVSYGMLPLIRTNNATSIFSIWNNENKILLTSRNNEALLDDYLKFSEHHIRDFLILIKKALGNSRWDIRTPKGDGILTVTTVNSFIILMRMLIEKGLIKHDSIDVNIEKIAQINFKDAKSSQYASLAGVMLAKLIS